MKTNESRYALVMADLQVGDTSSVAGNPPALEAPLARIPATVLRIGRCMFLFDTQGDYGSLRRLELDLATVGRAAVTTPIEEALHLSCDDPTAKAISERFPDLKLFRLPWMQRL